LVAWWLGQGWTHSLLRIQTHNQPPNQPPTDHRARIQIKKSDEELSRGFGGAAAPVPAGKPAQPTTAAGEGEEDDDDDEGGGGPAKPMTTLMIYGDAKAIEIAMRMIDEAVDNREQKAKQRHKEYERKKEQKRRERQLYHLRHARDYEELGVEIGASKLDVKKAYRWEGGVGFAGFEGVDRPGGAALFYTTQATDTQNRSAAHTHPSPPTPPTHKHTLQEAGRPVAPRQAPQQPGGGQGAVPGHLPGLQQPHVDVGG
jgi:hypothetical protein